MELKKLWCFILKKTGFNQSVLYSILNRIIQSIGGIINVFLISKVLTSTEQGYFFSFISLISLQIFFEVGLSLTFIQFIAHARKNITPNRFESLSDKNLSKNKIASLFKLSLKVYSIISISFFLIVSIVGLKFFSQFSGVNDHEINWETPWIALTSLTSITLMLTPVFCLIEGIGKIKEVMRLRFFQTFIQTLVLIVSLSSGLKLMASPLAIFTSSLLMIIWVSQSSHFSLIKSLINLNHEKYVRTNFFSEIFPFQWKIALSWISGYFIFQLFTPVLFASKGAILAGQMGLTLTILNTILAFSLTWVNTKVSLFSSLIADKKFTTLNRIFKGAFIQSFIVAILTITSFNLFIYWINKNAFQITLFSISERLLPFWPIIYMSISTLLNQVISSMATYLRCFNKEPLLLQSITFGILWAFYMSLKYSNINVVEITSTYLIFTFISLIWTFYTFRKRSKIWIEEKNF